MVRYWSMARVQRNFKSTDLMKIDKEILTIIPARGGSKGVPNKNIKKLDGKPLIAYTIEAAKKSKYITNLIVSTDDTKIAEISKDYGASIPFIRPVKYATDSAKAIDVVKHALITSEKKDNKKYDIILYLEPPSPFKTTEDINNCIELFFQKNPSSVVSVNEANQYHPILMKKIEKGTLEPIWKDEPEGVPRQEYSPTSYMRNGAIYVLRRDNILNNIFYGNNIVPFIMPHERSICIDSILDWYSAEAMINSKLGFQG